LWDDRREKAEEYERSILLHLRQISLYDSPERMVSFMESVVVEGYLDRQPDLLSTIYDELDLERPIQLRQLFSPTGQLLAQPASFQPSRSAPTPTGQLPVLQVSSPSYRSAPSTSGQLPAHYVSSNFKRSAFNPTGQFPAQQASAQPTSSPLSSTGQLIQNVPNRKNST